MTNYFGKGCKYFCGQWEYDNPDKIGEPVLVFCNNTENKDSREGNCNPSNCPLKIIKS